MQQPVRKADYLAPAIQERGRLISADPFEVRALDILGAVALGIVFLPLMIFIALAVFVADPGPVFFKQKRIGRNGKVFDCYKFRTMAIDAEARLAEVLARDPKARAEWNRDHKLRDDPRIVGIGSFLRKSSLDELPQLWNVLKGDMSLVGPRPIVEPEAHKYGKYLAYYCSVRPGLTGLWQISGRNDVSYRRRVAFDVVYARKGKVADNVRILLLTVPSVLTSRGSY
ncbi:MAG: sugar transferase [Erythrobacter sp.]|nr:sugar transferase [Erythrobacter sp.]